MPSNEVTEFTVVCRVQTRWVPHFLGMLRYMEMLGNIGSSRNVSIMSDGDGDFRPQFTWRDSLPEPAKPASEFQGGDVVFDAG